MPRMTTAAESATQIDLDAPVESLAGVGPKRAASLHKLGLQTLGDLLDYLPRDYRFEGSERGVDELVNEQIQTVRGEVVAADYIAGRPRSRFEITLKDDRSGEKLACVWFNAAWMRTKVRPGMMLRVRGKVRTYRNFPQMANPKWEEVHAGAAEVDVDRFRPIYAATADLASEQIEAIIKEGLDAGVDALPEWFGDDLLRRRDLIGRRDAYRLIHQPADQGDAQRARRRIVYDELMLLQLGLAFGKRLRAGRISAPVLRIDRNLDQRIRTRFPFDLTARPAERRLRDRPRPQERCADEPPFAGRRRQRQDGRRPVRDAHRRRQQDAGGDARADGGAGGAALHHPVPLPRRQQRPRRTADRTAEEERARRPQARPRARARSTSPSARRRC